MPLSRLGSGERQIHTVWVIGPLTLYEPHITIFGPDHLAAMLARRHLENRHECILAADAVISFPVLGEDLELLQSKLFAYNLHEAGLAFRVTLLPETKTGTLCLDQWKERRGESGCDFHAPSFPVLVGTVLDPGESKKDLTAWYATSRLGASGRPSAQSINPSLRTARDRAFLSWTMMS